MTNTSLFQEVVTSFNLWWQLLLFPGGGGGTQIWVSRGVPLEPQNPFPSLRVILAKKGTHF